MDTKRQERRRYVIILCVCFLVLLVTNNADEEIQDGQKAGLPTDQGTERKNTANTHHDEDERPTNKEEERTQGGEGKVKPVQDVDPPPGDTQEDSTPPAPGSQKEEEEPKLNSPLPPDGDSNAPPSNLRKGTMDDTAGEEHHYKPDEGAEKVTRPDTPSVLENIPKDSTPGDTTPGPKTSAESTEPETPNTSDGSPSSDTKSAQIEPVPTLDDSTGDTSKPEPDSAPGELEADRKHEEVPVVEVVPEGKSSEDVKEDVIRVEETKGDAGDEQNKVAEEEPEAPKREQDLPSFDEWKQKIIAEQAEKAKQAKQEKMEAQAPQQVNKKKVNYASMTCGAKLLVANPEAKNAASILNENKDQYMIQPCQAKKWFVVELCEPVAIQSLEIANLELFSSLPESFIVYTSERYPTKEWKNLGTFRAREQRAVQSFPIMEEEMFSKYIKVEPLTHYGDEHYCPLTLVRVYGTTVVEDYEDSDHDHSTVEEDSTLSELAPEDEPSNLFTSATDTVISLVKTVLSPGEKEKEQKIDDIVKMNSTNLNKSLPNITHGLTPDGTQAAPCTPGVNSGEGAASHVNGGVVTQQPVTPEASDHPPIVTLIESHPHTILIPSLIKRCNFCQDLHQPSCYWDRSHICGYYRAANFVMGTSCASIIGPKSKEETEKILRQGPSSKSKPSAESYASDTSQGFKGEAEAPKTDTKDVQRDSVLSDEERQGGINSKEAVPSEGEIPGLILEPSVQGSEPSQALDGQGGYTSTPNLQISTSISLQRTEGTKPTVSISQTESPLTRSCDPSQTDCTTMGPDIVQIRPTTTEEAMRSETTPPEKVQGVEETKPVDEIKKTAEHPEATKAVPLQQPQGSGADNNGTASNGGVEKVIYADTPGSHDSEYELEMLPPPEDGEAIHKLSSGRRENAFMRLKNRIRALELNLTLSSRYLEELSKRYRREMEDMYLSLNKTILKLTNTSRTAEQRDVRQQANITDLTKRIKHLTEQVDTLKDSIGNIHNQVIERHLFLMMVEFVVFLLIITWLLNRVHQPQGSRASSQRSVTISGTASTSAAKQVVPTQPNKPPDKKKKPVHKVHRRRNSIDATPPRPKLDAVVSKQRSKDDIHLRLSGSESRFGQNVLDAAAAASSCSDFKEIVPKRKKKKKNKLMIGSQSTSNIASGSSQSKPQRSTSTSRVHHKDKVGLIFSSNTSNKRDTSPATSSCSSEGGELTWNNASGASAPLGGGKGKKQLGARRSLDLKDLNKQHSDPGPFRKHRRLASDGVTNNGMSPVTDIGPLLGSTKAANGNTPLSENPPSPAYSSTTWKTWLLGTRN